MPARLAANEQLRTIRDKTLADATEDVDETRHSHGLDAVFLADVLGDGSGHDNGDRVVRASNVKQQREQTAAQLASPLAREVTLDEPSTEASRHTRA